MVYIPITRQSLGTREVPRLLLFVVPVMRRGGPGVHLRGSWYWQALSGAVSRSPWRRGAGL